MDHLEQLPRTFSNLQFPMGDITESRNIEMVDSWIEEKGEYNYARFINYLQYASRPNGMDNTAVHDNHTAALDLCRWWDHKRGDGHKLAVTGFVIARTFMNDTRYLPKFDTDLTHELGEIRTDKQSRARFFGRMAWSCMESCHPVVHMQHEKLFDLSRQRFDLHTEENREQFLAGMTLPYVLSSTTRLLGYWKQKKSIAMKLGSTKELQEMEFDRLFTELR